MNELTILEILLDLACFFIACWLANPNPASPAHSTKIPQNPNFNLPCNTAPEESSTALQHQSEPKIPTQSVPELQSPVNSPNPQNEQAETPEKPQPQTNINKLPLRKARQIAKKLGIPQKKDGKDRPVKWLREQISNLLLEDRDRALPIVESCLQCSST